MLTHYISDILSVCKLCLFICLQWPLIILNHDQVECIDEKLRVHKTYYERKMLGVMKEKFIFFPLFFYFNVCRTSIVKLHFCIW